MTSMLCAYECNVRGTDWRSIINARTPGKAKSEYWRDVRESWPDIPFTAITVRKIGRPVTSDEFRQVAAYRGVTFECGDAVVVDGDQGVIVGHNAHANFDVLFDTGRYSGQVLGVHPASIDLPAPPTGDER